MVCTPPAGGHHPRGMIWRVVSVSRRGPHCPTDLEAWDPSCGALWPKRLLPGAKWLARTSQPLVLVSAEVAGASSSVMAPTVAIKANTASALPKPMT